MDTHAQATLEACGAQTSYRCAPHFAATPGRRRRPVRSPAWRAALAGGEWSAPRTRSHFTLQSCCKCLLFPLAPQVQWPAHQPAAQCRRSAVPAWPRVSSARVLAPCGAPRGPTGAARVATLSPAHPTAVWGTAGARPAFAAATAASARVAQAPCTARSRAYSCHSQSVKQTLAGQTEARKSEPYGSEQRACFSR